MGLISKISLKKLTLEVLTGPRSKFLICIENAKMKKIKTSVSREILSAETDVFQNAKFDNGEQIKNLDRRKNFFTKILMVFFCYVFQ